MNKFNQLEFIGGIVFVTIIMLLFVVFNAHAMTLNDSAFHVDSSYDISGTFDPADAANCVAQGGDRIGWIAQRLYPLTPILAGYVLNVNIGTGTIIKIDWDSLLPFSDVTEFDLSCTNSSAVILNAYGGSYFGTYGFQPVSGTAVIDNFASSSPSSSKIISYDNPAQNIWNGLVLFFITFFGLLFYFKTKGGD